MIGKLLESLALRRIERTINSTSSPNDHGFFSGHSTVSSAVRFTSYIRGQFGLCAQVDFIFTDLAKVFDTVNHEV